MKFCHTLRGRIARLSHLALCAGAGATLLAGCSFIQNMGQGAKSATAASPTAAAMPKSAAQADEAPVVIHAVLPAYHENEAVVATPPAAVVAPEKAVTTPAAAAGSVEPGYQTIALASVPPLDNVKIVRARQVSWDGNKTYVLHNAQVEFKEKSWSTKMTGARITVTLAEDGTAKVKM